MIKNIKIIFLVFLTFLFFEKANVEITDSLFMTVGDRAITNSDLLNEMKIILILNNQSYSEDKREQLQKSAVNSIVKRNVKQIEIDRYEFYEFNKEDFIIELTQLANNLSVDLETLKNICASNELDFQIIEDQVKVELLWNSLIFQLYKTKITINPEEIEEQLKLMEKQKKSQEYLISEILIRSVEDNLIENEIENLKNNINLEGFENIARTLSISESALNGGDLGWVNENSIAKEIKSIIINTPVGSLSKPILLPEGILIFKIRNKRMVDENISLEERKDQLVKSEKNKILNMHSLSHYDRLRRSISIKFMQ